MSENMTAKTDTALDALTRFLAGRPFIVLTTIAGDRLEVNGEQIVDEIDALQARLQAAEGLAAYATHRPNCPNPFSKNCECGYYEARRAYSALARPAREEVEG